jgi:4-hydroxybenzoate polyprenyltransferase
MVTVMEEQKWVEPAAGWRPAIRLLRPEQWVKNLLVLLPLLMSHRFLETALLWRSLAAVIAFSLVASAGYIWNDWLDRHADALHVRKRKRPLASGAVSGRLALAEALGCLLAGFATGWVVEPHLAGLLLGYLGVSLLYSFALKRVALLDAVVLALFYGARIYAGHLATGIVLSPWLIGFCLATFFSLAMLKRYSELVVSGQAALEGNRRAYRRQHRDGTFAVGIFSAVVSVAVMILYVDGETAKELYRRPHVLWLICPILAVWFSRAWMLAKKGLFVDDPLAFAAADRTTWGLVGAMAVVWLVAF